MQPLYSKILANNSTFSKVNLWNALWSQLKISLSVTFIFSWLRRTAEIYKYNIHVWTSVAKHEDILEVFGSFFCDEKNTTRLVMMEWLNFILTYFSIILLFSVLLSSISDRWDYRVKMFWIYLWFFLAGILGNNFWYK